MAGKGRNGIAFLRWVCYHINDFLMGESALLTVYPGTGRTENERREGEKW